MLILNVRDDARFNKFITSSLDVEDSVASFIEKLHVNMNGELKTFD